MKERLGGKEKKLAFGKYEDAPLKTVRSMRDEARAILALGDDPAGAKTSEEAFRKATEKHKFGARPAA